MSYKYNEHIDGITLMSKHNINKCKKGNCYSLKQKIIDEAERKVEEIVMLKKNDPYNITYTYEEDSDNMNSFIIEEYDNEIIIKYQCEDCNNKIKGVFNPYEISKKL